MKFDPFSGVELAPRDPILGVNEAFAGDARTTKVNLGVGVYTNEEGKIPLLRAVREAEASLVTAAKPRGYLPIDGIAAYDQAVQRLLFGDKSPLLAEGRLVTAQALGGTGALKIGADFLRRFCPAARVLISDPSWENHRALFESAGFQVDHYPYYDAQSHGLNFAGMSSALTASSVACLAGIAVIFSVASPLCTSSDSQVSREWPRSKPRALSLSTASAVETMGSFLSSSWAATSSK